MSEVKWDIFIVQFGDQTDYNIPLPAIY